LNREHDGCVRPTLFQMIERPQLCIEYVNNNICVIDENPTRSGISFDVPWTQILLGKLVTQRSSNRAQLALILTRADNEEIRNRGKLVNVKNLSVNCRGIGDDVCDGNRQLATSNDRICRGWGNEFDWGVLSYTTEAIAPPETRGLNVCPYGGPGRVRTCDQEVMSPVLYR